MKLYLLCLLFAAPLCAQSDTVLTQTLIGEIRALRQELQATNITSQRVQIALYRLQAQTATVNTAQQRLDSSRTRRAEAEAERRSLASQLEVAEAAIRNNTADSAMRKEFEDNGPRVKAALAAVETEVAARRAAESDAETQLNGERVRLSELQSLLDRLDKALDELARGVK